MDRETARKRLNIKDSASEADIEAAWRQRQEEILGQLRQARDSVQRQRSTVELDELQQARDILLTAANPSEQQIGRKTSGLSDSQFEDVGYDDLPTQMPGLQAGEVLSGRFEIVEEIGLGGMGVVYRARDRKRNLDIAIKVMKPGLLKNEAAQQRFSNEARIAIDLSHPHIVKTHDVNQDGVYQYLTMELLQGRSLRAEIEHRKHTGQKWEVNEVISIADTLCQALSYAHKKTIHRDIKPENIWLDQEGQAKLMDFGIAKLMSSSQMTRTAAMMGSVGYMAPELMTVGANKLDHRADQYAVGVMVYELLVGRVPAGVTNKAVHEVRADVSKSLSHVIMQALASQPEERFENCAVFAERLKAAVRPAINFKQYLLPLAAVVGVLLVAGIWVMKPKDTPLPPAPVVVTPQPDPPKVPEVARVKPIAVQPKAEPVKVVEAPAIKEPPKTIEAPKPVEAKAEVRKDAVVATSAPQIEMVAIPGRNYELGKYEVTQGEWQAVMGNNPSYFKECGKTCPVEQVSWNEVQEFLKKLNSRTGSHYRLPTEVEWEYACYGGSKTEYCGGDNLDAVGWYVGNSGNKTHAVGRKQANGYGLYDMSGNVWEWMENCYDSSCDSRVLRGGSWDLTPANLRAASRNVSSPVYRGLNVGFRVAR